MNLIKGIALFLTFMIGVFLQPFFWLIAYFIPNDRTLYYHNLRNFVHHSCQCDSSWHNAFFSHEDFERFDKSILKSFKPLGPIGDYTPKPKIRFLGFEYGAEKAEGGFIYKCKTCYRLWELSDPDHAYRGYFKGIDLTEIEIETYLTSIEKQ